jgi:hypothetical protein
VKLLIKRVSTMYRIFSYNFPVDVLFSSMFDDNFCAIIMAILLNCSVFNNGGRSMKSGRLADKIPKAWPPEEST